MDTQEPMHCRSCGELVYMLAHIVTGKPAPIEAKTSPNGNVQMDLLSGTYWLVPKEQATLTESIQPGLHLNHFASCNAPRTWRKK